MLPPFSVKFKIYGPEIRREIKKTGRLRLMSPYLPIEGEL